jgi:hypothetical protein
MPDPKWHNLNNQSLLLNMSSIRTVTVTDKKDYVLWHVSFQSTGGTNISTVNALLLVDLYVCERNKSRGQQKRTWGIEMNEAQDLPEKLHCG